MSWSKIVSYRSLKQYAANATVVEYAIPLKDLGGVKNAINIGFAWNDSAADKLPVNNSMAAVPINGSSPVPEPTPTTEPSLITVDGNKEEWSQIAAAASGSSKVKSVKVLNDAEFLYMLIEGEKLDNKLQVYINSDVNEKTGYQTSRWTTAGIDYLLESGKLYSYSGNGGNWSFSPENLSQDRLYVSSSSQVELAIPLADLKVSSGQSLKLGILLNDNKVDKLPTKGEMLTYNLK